MRIKWLCGSAAALAVCLCLSATPARGVVIASGDGSGNTTASGNFADPFAHVGIRNGNSAVYLGYGAVLTANHAGGGNSGVFTFEGNDYSVVADSKLRLHDPGSPGIQVDLALYQITGYTGLEPLTRGAAQNGATVRMVGNGFDRETGLTHWNVTVVAGPDNDIWNEVTPPPPADRQGYKALTSRTLRWGENVIAGNGSTVNNTTTKRTVFNSNGLTHEAQGISHDSGGGVFQFNGVTDTWELVGILLAIGTYDNQPQHTAVFGNDTLFTDLVVYEGQIADYLAGWTLMGDANRDGRVDGRDYLAVEQHFGSVGVADGTLPGDANHDGVVDAADLLAVEQHFGQVRLYPGGASADTVAAIPEPTAALLLSAGLSLLLRRRG